MLNEIRKKEKPLDGALLLGQGGFGFPMGFYRLLLCTEATQEDFLPVDHDAGSEAVESFGNPKRSTVVVSVGLLSVLTITARSLGDQVCRAIVCSVPVVMICVDRCHGAGFIQHGQSVCVIVPTVDIERDIPRCSERPCFAPREAVLCAESPE